MARGLALLLAIAIFGCDQAEEGLDAGVTDAIASTDAAEPDSGVTPDAGVEPDSGEPPDAGDLPDSGVVPGFGDPCTIGGVTPCPGDLICLSPIGNDGFCSANCPVQGRRCQGTPPGTYAACVIGEAGTPNGMKACAFLCELSGMTFTCPGTLTCEALEDPPGSGQHLCLP